MEGGYGSGGWGVAGWGGSVYDRPLFIHAASSDAPPIREVVVARAAQEQSFADDLSAVSGSLFNSFINEIANTIFSSSSLAGFSSAVEELAASNDENRSNADFKSLIAEVASIFDAASSSQNFKVIIEESSSGQSFVSALQDFNAQIEEGSSGEAIPISRFAFLSDVIEGLDATDTLDANLSIGGVVSEFVVGVGNYSAQQDFDVKAFEGCRVEYAPAAFQNFASNVLEQGLVVDALQGRFLWNPVDDSQPQNWRDVITTN